LTTAPASHHTPAGEIPAGTITLPHGRGKPLHPLPPSPRFTHRPPPLARGIALLPARGKETLSSPSSPPGATPRSPGSTRGWSHRGGGGGQAQVGGEQSPQRGQRVQGGQGDAEGQREERGCQRGGQAGPRGVPTAGCRGLAQGYRAGWHGQEGGWWQAAPPRQRPPQPPSTYRLGCGGQRAAQHPPSTPLPVAASPRGRSTSGNTRRSCSTHGGWGRAGGSTAMPAAAPRMQPTASCQTHSHIPPATGSHHVPPDPPPHPAASHHPQHGPTATSHQVPPPPAWLHSWSPPSTTAAATPRWGPAPADRGTPAAAPLPPAARPHGHCPMYLGRRYGRRLSAAGGSLRWAQKTLPAAGGEPGAACPSPGRRAGARCQGRASRWWQAGSPWGGWAPPDPAPHGSPEHPAG